MGSPAHICAACQTSNPPQAVFCFGCGQQLEPKPITSDLLHQRYRLLHRLGAGGFGAVYQAEDRQLGNRLVAVKEMSTPGNLNLQERHETTEAFKREALLLAELMHPNLPRIHDHFSEGGHWYLVMDYIAGETLEAYLARQPENYLPLTEALDIGLQLCEVLDYLHTRPVPIIFRDLKPLNIMHTPTDHLYLIDFGIARHFKPGQMKDTVAFGSPGYAAPEQYGKTQTTPRSDIYSLGATLHQMLTGIDPSLNPFHFSPLHLPSGKPVPRDLTILVARMVAMEKSTRPESMHEVKTLLQKIAQQVASGSFNTDQASASPVSQIQVTPVPVPSEPPIAPGTLRCQHKGKHYTIRALAWSPDSKLLASAGDGNLVDIWDAQSGQSVDSYQSHWGNIRCVRWSPDGKYIASGGEDKTVQIWDVHSRQLKYTYKGHTHLVTGLGWSPDSQHVVSSSVDKSVRVWDIQTGGTDVTYTHHRDIVYCATWSPDGQYIASGSYDRTAHVWEALSGRHLLTYDGHSALIYALAWSPEGQRLASGSDDTTLRIWNAFDSHTITTCNHTGPIESLSWSPDGTRVVSCGSQSTTDIRDVTSGQSLFTYHGHQTSPEWQALQRILSGPAASVKHQLSRYSGYAPAKVRIVAWSPDGQWIASGDTSNMFQVWHAA